MVKPGNPSKVASICLVSGAIEKIPRVFFYNRCFSLTLNLFSDMTLKNRQPQ